MLKYDDQHDGPTAKFFIAFARIWFDTLQSVALIAGLQVLNAKPVVALLLAADTI